MPLPAVLRQAGSDCAAEWIVQLPLARRCYRPHAGAMKHLGLIGGMSWESSALYYRWINQRVREQLGGLHSARLTLHSIDFHELEQLQRRAAWNAAAALLIDAAQRLERAGAELLVLCSNTMHEVAPQLHAACTMPLLHIADVTAQAIELEPQIRRVGLLATRFTAERSFYVERLQQHGLEALVPEAAQRELVHRIIFDELCVGRIEAGSRQQLQRVVAALVERGAQAVILGCTELTLLLTPEQLPVPVFDSTRLHVEAAVAAALAR